MSRDLAEIWPLFELRIWTPRLELAIPDTADLLNLARVSAEIQPNGAPRYQRSELYEPSPLRERNLLQQHWRALAHWRPKSWDLRLAIRLNGRAIGIQNMWASDFATVRSVETGSWITQSQQGLGYGTEARGAVLEFAFNYLSALEAHTSYIDGNMASEAVSRKLGYTYNGRRVCNRDGIRSVEHLMLLEADAWKQHRPADVSVQGVTQDCRELFGL